MTMFLANLVLMLVWAAATTSAAPANLLLGFVLGYLALWWAQPGIGRSNYFRKLPQAIGFAVFFLWELVQSNFRVAWDVVTPRAYRKPAIVAVPLDARTDAEITLLTNLITLTPGTLSLDVSTDRKTLYVHAMFADDPEEVRRVIKDGFERRVLALLR